MKTKSYFLRKGMAAEIFEVIYTSTWQICDMTEQIRWLKLQPSPFEIIRTVLIHFSCICLDLFNPITTFNCTYLYIYNNPLIVQE